MDYIDTLRGIACLLVLLRHSLDNYPVEVEVKLVDLPFRLLVELGKMGWLGVNLFLVLSGFCLYYPLIRRSDISSISLDLKTFAKRRARRILPPYYAALAIYSSVILISNFRHHLPLSQGFAGWFDIPAHILMLHNLHPSSFGTINSAFWSLALESQLYVVFPLLISLAASRGMKVMLMTVLVIAVAWQTYVFLRFSFFPDWSWYHALPARCFEFALGMAAAYFVANPNKSLIRCCKIFAPILALSGVCLVSGVWLTSRVSMFGPFINSLWGIIFFCVLVLLNEVPQKLFQTNLFLRLLTNLGVISYSLYLVHNLVFRFVQLPEGPEWYVVLRLCFRFLVSILVAYVFFLLFERPFLVGTKKSSPDLVGATVASPAP